MYETFYGLSELPFELTANPKYLFLTARQREALSTLQYGLLSAKSLTVLIGEAGTGKTTLIRTALESERCRRVRCIYLNNPALRTDDFIRLLALKFDLGPEAGTSKALLLERLELLLRERRADGEITALVIDEAQSLSIEMLEEIRLLANIETPTAKLLPLVLAGQPGLGERLEDPNLRQLKQRVTLRCDLEPFDVVDTAAYIASRFSTAGGVAARVFTREAITLIHEGSGGIPRTINVICDNALLSGMALGHQKVDRAIVVEACRDLRLKSNGEQAPTGDRSNQLDDLSRRSDAKADQSPWSDAKADQSRRSDAKADQSHRSDAKADQSRRSDAKADEKTAVGLGAPAFTLRAAGRIISE
jgi:general secretion pathway protein A